MKKKKIVAIYARVSTLDKGQDPTNQLLQLKEYIEHRSSDGWELGEVYVDRVSGKTSQKRPQFLRMMADASQRRFDVLLFWSLDRFSREGTSATLQHLERLTADGIGWKSFTEQYLDSLGAFGDAILSVLACVAKQERIRLSERTRAGLARARKEGQVLGRPRVKLTDDGKRVGLARVLELRNQPSAKFPDRPKGLREIADELGCSVMTISRLLKAS